MYLKKTLKVIARIILGFVVFIILYLMSALLLSMLTIPKEQGESIDVAIYIITNGDHTDVVVPVKNQVANWAREVKYQNTINSDTSFKYLALGWGDKGFFLNTPTWAQLKFSTAFKAAFALSTSAIHATYYKTMTESADCKKINISNAQYVRHQHKNKRKLQ
jgi:uncharacterized protein (TIGR02117 family)